MSRSIGWINPDWRTLADDPEHVAIASKVARQFAACNPAIGEEYEAEAYWALCVAAWQFRPDRATCPFSIYLGTVVRQQLTDLRWKMGSHGIPGLGQRLRFRQDVRRVDRLRDDDPIFAPPLALATDREDFEFLIRDLPARHRVLLRWMYLEGWTKREAADAMGISRNTADKIHDQALFSLRSLFPRPQSPARLPRQQG